MSHYRRYFVPGGTYFFTLTADCRRPIFRSDWTLRLLGSLLRHCQLHDPVEVVAIVVLPDHLHTLWSLPPGDNRYSSRWNWIKGEFTKAFLANGGAETKRRPTLANERRRSVWQRRFWEHTIRDEDDLERHFDYIHYNPVKHGYVQNPRDWPWSSFHRWVQRGQYGIDWGRGYVDPMMPGNAEE
jgi:putative transposase